MASNFVGHEPMDEVRRWDSKEKKYVMVKRPAIVRLYNISMGGVDKSDFLIALYRTFIRSRKWTLRVIFHYFNLAVCNAWLEYQKDKNSEGILMNSQMDLLEFTLEVTQALAFSGSANSLNKKRGRPSGSNSPAPSKRKVLQNLPISDIRYDSIGHWPIHNEGHEQRCKLETCGGRSRIVCDKCNVPLCLSKTRNCFRKFHNK